MPRYNTYKPKHQMIHLFTGDFFPTKDYKSKPKKVSDLFDPLSFDWDSGDDPEFRKIVPQKSEYYYKEFRKNLEIILEGISLKELRKDLNSKDLKNLSIKEKNIILEVAKEVCK